MVLNKQLKIDFNDLMRMCAINNNYDPVIIFFKNWSSKEELVDKVMIWGHFFMHHYLIDKSPVFHRDLIEYIFSKRNEYHAAPRGFSKTTIIQLSIAFIAAHRLRNFVALIEKTATEAAEVIKGVHDEFVDNERIFLVYGNLMGKKDIKNELTPLTTTEREARGDVFINGVRIRGKGFNSTIRGLKSRQFRPDLIILDDVEEDEHINNPEQRYKYEQNYNKGIQPAVDPKGSIKIFGTILHQDSLLNNQILNHNGSIYRAYDKNDPENTLLWPERWPFEKLEQKKRDMMSSGQSSSAFAQEYLNDPVSEEERVFKYHFLWEMIPKPDAPEEQYQVPAERITMEEFEKVRKNTTLNGYAMIDVADTTTANADWTGSIVTFVAPNGARFRVHVAREKRNIKGVVDLVFEIWEKWSPKGLIKIGIEKKGFNDQILPLLKEEMERRHVYPVVEELKPMGRNKEGRIQGALAGHYETGKMVSVGTKNAKGYFIPVGDTNSLLNELYDFPAAKHDDLSDAEAYQADIVVVPLHNENMQSPHHNPQDDPFEADFNPLNSHIAGFEDPSDVY
jgi:phage terminase large subunit-like protein